MTTQVAWPPPPPPPPPSAPREQSRAPGAIFYLVTGIAILIFRRRRRQGIEVVVDQRVLLHLGELPGGRAGLPIVIGPPTGQGSVGLQSAYVKIPSADAREGSGARCCLAVAVASPAGQGTVGVDATAVFLAETDVLEGATRRRALTRSIEPPACQGTILSDDAGRACVHGQPLSNARSLRRARAARSARAARCTVDERAWQVGRRNIYPRSVVGPVHGHVDHLSTSPTSPRRGRCPIDWRDLRG